MPNSELIEALDALISSKLEAVEKPQNQAAHGMKVAAWAMGICAMILTYLAIEVRNSTLSNADNITDLDKRVSVVESVLRATNYKDR